MKNSSTRTMTAKRIAVAVAAVCATLSAPSFAAGSDMKALMDLLLKKGVISQQEYDQNIQAAAEDQAFKEKRLADDVAKLNKAAEKSAKSGFVKSNGFGFESADGANSINLTGRLHFDARSFGNDFGQTVDRDAGSMADRFTVRRARLGVNGVFNKDMNYELVTNLTGATAKDGSTTATSTIDTAWINYMASPEVQFRFGRMKQPLAMETLTSSNNIDFMERSYLDQLAPGKQNGMMFHGEKSGFVYAFSGWQQGFDPLTTTNGLAPQVGARVATDLANAFNISSNSVMHIGFSAMTGKQEVVPSTSSQKGGNNETKGAFLAFRDENLGLNNVYRNRILGFCDAANPQAGGTNACASSATTGVIGFALPAQEAAIVKKVMGAFEAAYATGPLKIQYEYADAKLTASGNAANAAGTTIIPTTSSGHAKVQYLSLMYNLTGEDWKTSYKSGLFGSIKPNSNFNFQNGSGKGAWQVGLRVSRYDASDFGGSTEGTTIADEETTTSNGKHSCDGGFSRVTGGSTCYQVGGSPIATTYTTGVNWILNPNARVMLNYSMTKFDNLFFPIDTGTVNSKSTASNASHVISLRSQFNF